MILKKMFTIKNNECKRLIKAINRQYLFNKLRQNNKHTLDIVLVS